MPVRLMPVRTDLLLRPWIADVVGERVTGEAVATLRNDVVELYARLDETEANVRA
jgi:hypothetical protein